MTLKPGQNLSHRCINETEAEERARLAHVIERIDAEIGAFGERLDHRLGESRRMVVAIQEQKRDMDHAEKAVMRQSVNTLSRVNEHGMEQHRKLIRLAESPYFGRIDLGSDAGAPSHPIYVGLHSFADPETGEQFVHDWRAPISSMFYDFELGRAHFDAPAGREEHEIVRKRQYQIERRELRLMLETSLSIQDDMLRETLSRASDDAMKNIVATIQREQNQIIRNDRSHALIIQGAAGSGKTSIALHRIAFLLYRFRDEIRSNEILIVSPNAVFADYISQVLPEIGEEMIQETTMDSIASRLLGAGYKFQSFAEQVGLLLEGYDRAYAERVRFKGSTEFLSRLDEFIAHMRATNFKPAEISIPPYTLDAAWVADRFRPRATLPIGDQITKTLDGIVDYMRAMYNKTITGRDRAKVRAQLKAMFRITTLPAIYKEFYAWLGSPGMFRKAKGGRYEHADVFPLIYLARLTDRITPMPHVKHLVIDEMQDYTPIQYKVIDMVFPCRKTILGDANQSVSPLSSSNADSIARSLRDADTIAMHRSYRSTIEITTLAQSIQRNPDLQPIERHGDLPALIACASEDEQADAVRGAIDDFHRSGHNTLGVICKTTDQARALFDALDNPRVHLLDAAGASYSGGVMIATAFLAKGLEFDRVIVPFCDDANYTATIDKHMLYIACTRAMHRLTLVHTGRRSLFLDEAVRLGHTADISAQSRRSRRR